MESTKTKKIKLIKNCNRCGEELCCYRTIGTFCPTGCADYQMVSKGRTINELKVGDKVRIKTEQELLAEGWTHSYITYWEKEGKGIDVSYCGETFKILRVDNENIYFVSYYVHSLPISAVAEVIPQTLDEYICSLSLQERARRFISYSGNSNWWSTITEMDYNGYDETLQATIEALKSPKE